MARKRDDLTEQSLTEALAEIRVSLTPDMIAAGAAIGAKYFHEFNPAQWWFDRLARETFEAMVEAGGYAIKAQETGEEG